jgi:hypothetical protein
MKTLEKVIHLSKKGKFLYYVKLRLRKFFSSKYVPRLSKNITESERVGVAIFINLLSQQSSELYYDIETSECYIKSEDNSLFLFLEKGNLKVINSIFGYDVAVHEETEGYLTEKFKKELNKRRLQFKNEALEKVDHSLHKTFEKLIFKEA